MAISNELKNKLQAGVGYPENVSYLGNKPNFTRDTFDTLSDMRDAAEAGYIDEGHLSYCKEDGKHYKYTKVGDNSFEWVVFKPGGSNEGSLGIYTQEGYDSIEEEKDKPNDYILIPNNERPRAEVQEKTYTTSEDGNIIDILFSTIRALQSKVAKLENTFATGMVSLKESETAASVLIDEDLEEKEPLWALDPEDLSEIAEASVSVSAGGDLIPTDVMGTVPAYLNNSLRITSECSKVMGQFMNFEASDEAKQCLYMTLKGNDDNKPIVKIKLGYKTESGDYSTEKDTLNLGNFLSPQKQNILLIISREVYDEDTETYYGKNYAWVSCTNTNREEIKNGYFNKELGELVDSEILLDKRYYIEEVIFGNSTLWKCEAYVKNQAFTNTSDIPLTKDFDEGFSYKVAHIAIRSVKKYTTLQELRSRLLQNELVWVEEQNKLYIISTEDKNIVSLGSGDNDQTHHEDDETTMTTEELIRLLKEAGYVTSDDKLSSLRLNDIGSLTFVHTESGRKYTMSIDSDGNILTKKIESSITQDEGLSYDPNITVKKRGAVARYNLGNSDYETENKITLNGTERNIIAKGDRVRFGSWYIPTVGQTNFNCTHEFIEVVNSGTDPYPLDNSVLVILKGTTGTIGNASFLMDTSDLSLDFFPLSGVVKAGSSYLIRAKRHLSDNDPRGHIKILSYDKELWKNGELYSLEKIAGMAIIHKNRIYNSNGDAIFTISKGTKEQQNVAYVPSLTTAGVSGSTFPAHVSPWLVDVISFSAGLRSNENTTNVWGDVPYTLISNSIIKDQFELDPAKQAFKSLTSDKDTSQYRLNKISQETIPLDNEKISFFHTSQTFDVSKFTPKASWEGKNVCTDKTWLDNNKPNMPTVSFGIDMETTRCFNWISVGTFDEFVWIRKKGDTEWIKNQRFESYKSGDGSGDINGYVNGTSMQRKVFSNTLIDSAYKRIEGIFPALKIPYCVHKCIVYLGQAPSKSDGYKKEYEYIVGRSKKNGDPDLDHCSDVLEFTVHSSVAYDPIVYHVTDQQGFGWMEYQVWAAAANELKKRIDRETIEYTTSGENISTKGTFPVLINTGDMTQNGTRINEWLDYYNSGKCLFDHLEQMNCVGNNDLGNSWDITALGTGDDAGKSSPYFYYLCYCYEVDDDSNLNNNRVGWTHPLVYNNNFIPSTYYFYHGKYSWVSVNSEITPITVLATFGQANYNLYTGYHVGPSPYNIDYSSDDSWCLARTISGMIDRAKSEDRTTIVYCHEMPYTVITNEYLREVHGVSASRMDRSCQYSSSDNKSSLIGSHLNRISASSDYDNDDNYWFSRLLENKGIRLCIGGHKHSYTATWPVLEGDHDLKNATVNGVSEFQDYDTSKLFVSVVSREYYDSLPAEVGDNPLTFTYNGKTYKKFRLNNECYYLIVTTDENLGGNSKHGVVYFMCQATGYKLQSNKELPSSDQSFSMIVPKTSWAYKKGEWKATSHHSQRSPMYAKYTYSDGKINIDLFRVVNIKVTTSEDVTEFNELKYSELPMISEKLLINLETYKYNNYWYTESPASDYSFDYTDIKSDRCWKEYTQGNDPKPILVGNASGSRTTLDNLFSTEHTLIVEL